MNTTNFNYSHGSTLFWISTVSKSLTLPGLTNTLNGNVQHKHLIYSKINRTIKPCALPHKDLLISVWIHATSNQYSTKTISLIFFSSLNSLTFNRPLWRIQNKSHFSVMRMRADALRMRAMTSRFLRTSKYDPKSESESAMFDYRKFPESQHK